MPRRKASRKWPFVDAVSAATNPICHVFAVGCASPTSGVAGRRAKATTSGPVRNFIGRLRMRRMDRTNSRATRGTGQARRPKGPRLPPPGGVPELDDVLGAQGRPQPHLGLGRDHVEALLADAVEDLAGHL